MHFAFRLTLCLAFKEGQMGIVAKGKLKAPLSE